MLDGRADPHAVEVPGQNLAFLAAARHTSALEVCFLLHTRRVDVTAVDTTNRQTPLFFAVRPGRGSGGAGCAEFLLTCRCDANHMDVNGQTALQYAAQRTDGPQCVEVVLAAGANPNHMDWYGISPCLYAAQFDPTAAVLKALLCGRADVHLPSAAGHTALFCARSAPVVEALLASRAKHSAKDPEGRTPLFFAVRAGAHDAVRALVDGGADVKVKDKAGRTCLDFEEMPVPP